MLHSSAAESINESYKHPIHDVDLLFLDSCSSSVDDGIPEKHAGRQSSNDKPREQKECHMPASSVKMVDIGETGKLCFCYMFIISKTGLVSEIYLERLLD